MKKPVGVVDIGEDRFKLEDRSCSSGVHVLALDISRELVIFPRRDVLRKPNTFIFYFTFDFYRFLKIVFIILITSFRDTFRIVPESGYSIREIETISFADSDFESATENHDSDCDGFPCKHH